MIITKEGEEFQSLLKKVEYLENVIMCSKYYAGCDLMEEKKTPKLKTGDWVYRTIGKDDKAHAYGRIFRIVIKGENDRDMSGVIEDCEGYSHFRSSLRHATPQEIEQHLRKICDEKYIGKKTKCLDFDDYHTVAKFHLYDVRDDMLYYETSKRDCVCLYRKGRFAEIVPEKKRVPKSKQELIKFIIEDLASFFYARDMPLIMDIVRDLEE